MSAGPHLFRLLCRQNSHAAKPAMLRREFGIRRQEMTAVMETRAQAGVAGSLLELRQVAEVLLRQAHVVDVVPAAAVSCNVPVAIRQPVGPSQRPVLSLARAGVASGRGGAGRGGAGRGAGGGGRSRVLPITVCRMQSRPGHTSSAKATAIAASI